MPRRASLFVFLGFAVALVLVAGISAGAETGDGSIKAKKTDVAAAQDRLMEIRMEASAAEASYNNALYEMNQLNGQIAGAKEDLDGARKRFKAAKKSLEERAALVYKSQNVAFIDVLVGVDNFTEFASRLDLWIRLLGRERADFVEVREAKKDLLARKDRLEAEHQQRIDAVEKAMAQKERAEKAEARAEAYLDSLNADLRAAIRAAQDRRVEQAQAAAAAIIEPAPQPEGEKESKPAPRPVPVPVPESQPEPVPEVEASEVKQVPVPKPDLGSEQAAADREAAAKAAAAQARRLAEQRAAERKAAREAEQQAAAEQRAAARAARLAQQRAARQEAREEAQREAELAAERAAARRAAREEAERQAERAAERAAIEEAAAQQAAAERAAARRAAERRAERLAEQRAAAREAEQAAEASASASASAALAAERADARREARAAEASASASASSSASASAPAAQGAGRGGKEDASASSSASASASASSSAAPGGGGASAMGGDVLAVAQQHLGTPYVLSPPGPCEAFEAEDCSCFTLLVFQEFGIALPDSPAAQMGYGTPVSGAPLAGDLLFWSEDGSGYITHVGIAMGDGTTIHASTDLYGEGVVTITNINYINGYVGARRLL